MRLLFVNASLAIIVFVAVPAIAIAEQYKEGDEIEVMHLREWRPAKVVKTNQRGDVLAEFEFAGGVQRQPFKATDIHYAYESGALARAKMWSDASGKFRQKAALIEVDDDTITLRKPDKTETKVAINKLSETDQQYVKKLHKESGTPMIRPPSSPPSYPPLDDFEAGSPKSSPMPAAAATTTRAPLAPDPLPKYLKLKQAGIGFPTEAITDRLAAVLAVGGKDGWLLAAYQRSKGAGDLPVQLIWASLERQKIEGRQSLPPHEIILDYHAPTHRLLTSSSMKTESESLSFNTLTLWEVLPTDSKVKPIVRWKADSRALHGDPWARIIDADVVVQRYKDNEYVGWDTTAKRIRYRLTQESFFTPLATLSGGRKYLFLPEDNGVRVLEAVTGRQVSAWLVDGGVSGIALSDDGIKAAVLNRTTLSVWDLTSATAAPQLYQAEAIGTPFYAELFWLGDDRLMVDHGNGRYVLYSLKLKAALWNYQFDHEAVTKFRGQRVREIVDQHLVYCATLMNAIHPGLAVGAVSLPGPDVNETEAALDPDSLDAVKPGTQVRIEVKAGANSAHIQSVLETKIKNNGWVLSPNATTVLVAEMKQGPQETVTYQMRGFGRPESTQTATISPSISILTINVGDKEAWVSGTNSGAPAMMILKEGQTVQSEVDRWQQPDAEFFDKVQIPPRIRDPAMRLGLGKTDVTTRGLVPVHQKSGSDPETPPPASAPRTYPPR